VVISFQHFIPHHPVCGDSERGLFIDAAATPPRRGGERLAFFCYDPSMPLSLKATVKEVQELSSLAGKAFASMFRRPHYMRDVLTQMDLIGVGSLTVVLLTGFFTGAVLALQTSKSLSTFGAISMNRFSPHSWWRAASVRAWRRSWDRCS
jgi:hypothetical protein